MKIALWLTNELKNIALGNLKFNLEMTDKFISEYDHETNTVYISEYVDSVVGKIGRFMGGRPNDVKHSYRHEIGHAFLNSIWDVTSHKRFIETFGDVDQDYNEYGIYRSVLLQHDNNYVSKYAQTHPEEDFAEVFAEYMEASGCVYEEDSPEVEKKKDYIEYLIKKYGS